MTAAQEARRREFAAAGRARPAQPRSMRPRGPGGADRTVVFQNEEPKP
ncbi:hypothetical protein SUDANB126_05914 [Streptomyces sp. enrichment culture]